MELYLMQHGEAVPESANPDRPLSREGILQIQASASAMKKMGIALDVIVCSSKKRSHQTAALIAEKVNYPYSDIIETETAEATAAPEEMLSFLHSYQGSKTVLIAGHLPSLANMASLLLGGSTPVRLRFENGALCAIDVSEPAGGQGELICHISAAQMRLIAET